MACPDEQERTPTVTLSEVAVLLLVGVVPLASATPFLVTGRSLLYDETVLPRFVSYWIVALVGLIAVLYFLTKLRHWL